MPQMYYPPPTPFDRRSIFGDTYAGVPNPQMVHTSGYPTRFHGPNFTTPEPGWTYVARPYARAPFMGMGQDDTEPLALGAPTMMRRLSPVVSRLMAVRARGVARRTRRAVKPRARYMVAFEKPTWAHTQTTANGLVSVWFMTSPPSRRDINLFLNPPSGLSAINPYKYHPGDTLNSSISSFSPAGTTFSVWDMAQSPPRLVEGWVKRHLGHTPPLWRPLSPPPRWTWPAATAQHLWGPSKNSYRKHSGIHWIGP